MNEKLFAAVKAAILPELGRREMVLTDPLTLQDLLASRISKAAIAAHSAFIREAINAEIDTWEQVPMRGAMKRKIGKLLD